MIHRKNKHAQGLMRAAGKALAEVFAGIPAVS